MCDKMSYFNPPLVGVSQEVQECAETIRRYHTNVSEIVRLGEGYQRSFRPNMIEIEDLIRRCAADLVILNKTKQESPEVHAAAVKLDFMTAWSR